MKAHTKDTKPKTDFKKMFQDAGLKNTVPRTAIAHALANSKSPKSAQELHQVLANKGIDLVTLYRTLASFEKAGIVLRIDLRKDAVSYELAAEHHHHHIVCTNCGTVEDFEICEMDALTKKIAAQASKFKVVREHSLELFGVCVSCAK